MRRKKSHNFLFVAACQLVLSTAWCWGGYPIQFLNSKNRIHSDKVATSAPRVGLGSDGLHILRGNIIMSADPKLASVTGSSKSLEADFSHVPERPCEVPYIDFELKNRYEEHNTYLSISQQLPSQTCQFLPVLQQTGAYAYILFAKLHGRKAGLPANCQHMADSPLARRYFALRHGESEANVDAIISSLPARGTTIHGLTSVGRRQARESASHLVEAISKDQLEVSISSVGIDMFERRRVPSQQFE